MKNLHYILLLLLLGSCSTFDENLNEPYYSLNLEMPLKEITTNLPIINIDVPQNELEEMLENFEEDIEIDGHFSLYRNNELLIDKEKIELELKGSYSQRFPLKSLGIKFDDEFDNQSRRLIKPNYILPHHNLDFIKAIRLRNSGNDFKQTMLKDLSYSQLAIQANLDIDVAYGEASLVFINEQFYGVLNLRTESNTNGMAGLYNVDKNDITLAKITGTLAVKDGDFTRIDNLLNAVENKNIPFLKAEIDMDNFIDYLVFETYITNLDWLDNNVRFYAIKDNKFRFVMYDLDKANWIKTNENPLEVIDIKTKNFVTDLFFVLYEDALFKEQFWDRYRTVLATDNLNSEKFKTIVYQNLETIELAMPMQIEKYNFPGSMTEWYMEVDFLINMFEIREAAITLLME